MNLTFISCALQALKPIRTLVRPRPCGPPASRAHTADPPPRLRVSVPASSRERQAPGAWPGSTGLGTARPRVPRGAACRGADRRGGRGGQHAAGAGVYTAGPQARGRALQPGWPAEPRLSPALRRGAGRLSRPARSPPSCVPRLFQGEDGVPWPGGPPRPGHVPAPARRREFQSARARGLLPGRNHPAGCAGWAPSPDARPRPPRARALVASAGLQMAPPAPSPARSGSARTRGARGSGSGCWIAAPAGRARPGPAGDSPAQVGGRRGWDAPAQVSARRCVGRAGTSGWLSWVLLAARVRGLLPPRPPVSVPRLLPELGLGEGRLKRWPRGAAQRLGRPIRWECELQGPARAGDSSAPACVRARLLGRTSPRWGEASAAGPSGPKAAQVPAPEGNRWRGGGRRRLRQQGGEPGLSAAPLQSQKCRWLVRSE